MAAHQAGPHVQVGESTTRGQIEMVCVDRIRPEAGLGRRRDREGHKALQRSIQQFGVLTPITVRLAPDASGEYLLIKGQGRTLACRMLGIGTIPALVVDSKYADAEKVQQFLVENVARLKMRPVDRALLISRARQEGEETSAVAERFGVSSSTVRRLESQLDGATRGEVAALRSGRVTLAVHAVIARHVSADERSAVVDAIVTSPLRTAELEALFVALGWAKLEALGASQRSQRLLLLAWACSYLAGLPRGCVRDRLQDLALDLPSEFESTQGTLSLVAP
jgi:ParB/RepB/Spo0J family partition protein